MEYLQHFRYGIIRHSVPIFSCIIWSIVVLLTVMTAVFNPACWILVVIIFAIAYAVCSPRMTVFDFQEKKFFCCRKFHPEKIEKMKSLSFAKIDHLCCNTLSCRSSTQFIGVCAVTHDGYKLPLFKVRRKHFDLFAETLPELAEKMGHIPITF